MQRASLCVVLFALALLAGSANAAMKTDGEGFIRNWLVLGPVQVSDKAGNHDEDNQKEFFDKEQFAGQFKATPAEGEKVKIGNAELAWKATQADDAILQLGEAENTLSFVVSYIVVENDIPNVTLSIGSDDGSCWRLNGDEVIRVYAGRAVEKDQNKSGPVTLKKGVNVLQGVIINGGGPTAACARFVAPVTNIGVQLTK